MTGRRILAELHEDDDFFLLAKSVGEFGDRELVPYLRRLGAEEFPRGSSRWQPTMDLSAQPSPPSMAVRAELWKVSCPSLRV